MQKDHITHAKQFCCLFFNAVDYVNIKIIQHTLKVSDSVFKMLKLDTTEHHGLEEELQMPVQYLSVKCLSKHKLLHYLIMP